MSSDYSIEIDISRALKVLDPAVWQRRERAAMEEAVRFLESEVEAGMPVDQGLGRGSVFSHVYGTPANLTGQVASPLVHVAVIESGRRPGETPPPTGPIRRWLEHKSIDGRLAFVVARAIGRRGLPAHHVFKNALEKNVGRIQAIFDRHMSR